MKILLLGSTGFVGKNVAELLAQRQVSFHTLQGKSHTDLRILSEVNKFFEQAKPDLVINCAAHVGSLNYVTKNAANIMLDNSRMILNTYEALAVVNPQAIVINPIANCAYPAKADTFVEDHWWDGHLHRSVLSYGSTRRLLWSVGESFAMQYGIRSINLLVPNMYGPFDSTNPNKAHALNALISKFVKAEKNKSKEIEIWGTGVAIREWLFAKDFAKAVYAILQNPNMVGLSEPVNIAQNFGLSVRELVQIIHDYFGNKFEIKWNANMPDGAPKKVMDDTRFKKVFNSFQFTAFDEGVKRTIEYYQSIYPY
ncbi:MAG: NAD-dependent epimerase/dehydratase family protein [Bacteroidetes bacterium]|nr:NAD-dependent epimerase/dehydratase family protein [Bacteroidota bacterium]MBS1540533.1 NAD-dependent epimerase/dehydratase family protein [Bacteroidota bacterium]